MLQVSGSLVDVRAHWGGCRGRRACFEVDGSFSEQHHVLERAEAGVPGQPALLQEPCSFGGSRISQTPFFKRKEKQGGLLAAGIGALKPKGSALKLLWCLQAEPGWD